MLCQAQIVDADANEAFVELIDERSPVLPAAFRIDEYRIKVMPVLDPNRLSCRTGDR
jgi:hypothetical protein